MSCKELFLEAYKPMKKKVMGIWHRWQPPVSKLDFVCQSLASTSTAAWLPSLCTSLHVLQHILFSFFLFSFSNNHADFFALFLFLEFLLHLKYSSKSDSTFSGHFKNNNYSTILGTKFSLLGTAQWMLR